MGDLEYWPTGRVFCFFFGRTPVSIGDEIRVASAVNVFGRMESGFDRLDQVEDGVKLLLKRVKIYFYYKFIYIITDIITIPKYYMVYCKNLMRSIQRTYEDLYHCRM